jgi:hypothetical protein
MTKATGTENVAAQPPWSVRLSVHDVPETGLRLDLRADEQQRAAVAKAADLLAVARLEAIFDIAAPAGGRLHVVGRVSATVRQACVVTLEPIDNEVEEAIDLIFDPAVAVAPLEAAERTSGRAPSKGSTKRSTKVEVDADEAPEPLNGDTVDLGALATEFLMLGLDPYPRKPGATFEVPQADDHSEHPFAALAKLRQGPGKDG